MLEMDSTHDAKRRSWVESANEPECDFPIQNLPFGVFRRAGSSEQPRIGVAIGDQILDIQQCVKDRLLQGISPECACALSATTLNQFMHLGRQHWKAARAAVGELLDWESKKHGGSATPEAAEEKGGRKGRERGTVALVPMRDAELLLPASIGDYTDFYASIHHARNVGSMFRPDNPLLPNYKHLPVGYHGRASSIVVSGTPIRRPMGQTVSNDSGPPIFGPCKLLDYEMEMGFFVGPGNELGSRISMHEAGNHIFGMVIVNDWSARDIQKWEYQPLGPFNAKNFATTISPWVVTLEALAPFRVGGGGPGGGAARRGQADPEILEYLRPVEEMGFDVTVEVWMTSQQMRERRMTPHLISRGNFADMYWTIAQMLVHHTSTGCNLRAGDLIASGTISGPTPESRGCLLERTWRGQDPIELPDGTQRKFLQDGDEVIMTAYCLRDGFAQIGFGECRGVVLPAQ
jgi:fumarylacetoacetase